MTISSQAAGAPTHVRVVIWPRDRVEPTAAPLPGPGPRARALLKRLHGARTFERERRVLCGRARGVVLEIGASRRRNARHYDPRFVTGIVSVETAPGPIDAVEDRYRVAMAPLSWTSGMLPLPAAEVDTIVSTFGLSESADPAGLLRELRRVLRPGGELLLLERGPAGHRLARLAQGGADRVWHRLTKGAGLGTDVAPLLREAGFVVGGTVRRPGGILGPVLRGSAISRAA